MTIETLLKEASATLQNAGYIHGEREASFIASKIFEQDSAWLISHSEDTADEEKVEAVSAAVKERIEGSPLAYILGEQPFLGWKFIADKRALIPRPETEYMVELLVKHVKEFGLQNKSVLEIGTGSGPIAIALKKFLPEAAVTATDISGDALELAQENAQRLQADVDFLEGNLFDPVNGRRFAVIAANLPYVPSERLSFVSDQILDWEPMVAIEAGSVGLRYITPFIEQLGKHLQPGGIAAIEMWHDHAPAVIELAKQHLSGYETIIEKDLAGFDRYAFFLPLRV